MRKYVFVRKYGLPFSFRALRATVRARYMLWRVTMLAIKISDVVASAIAARGKFGETHDDVLRRVFGIATASSPKALHGARGRGRTRHAETRLSSDMIKDGRLRVELEDAPIKDWKLPDKSDKSSIKRLRNAAFEYAREHGATQGQINAIGKALQQAGYYVWGPRKSGLDLDRLDE